MAVWLRDAARCPRCGVMVARDFEAHRAWHQATSDKLDAAEAAATQARNQLTAIRNRLDALEATSHTHPTP